MEVPRLAVYITVSPCAADASMRNAPRIPILNGECGFTGVTSRQRCSKPGRDYQAEARGATGRTLRRFRAGCVNVVKRTMHLGESSVRKRKDPRMAIDFSFPPEIDELRLKVRKFIEEVVRPAEARIAEREGDRRFLVQSIIEMRVAAKD